MINIKLLMKLLCQNYITLKFLAQRLLRERLLLALLELHPAAADAQPFMAVRVCANLRYGARRIVRSGIADGGRVLRNPNSRPDLRNRPPDWHDWWYRGAVD